MFHAPQTIAWVGRFDTAPDGGRDHSPIDGFEGTVGLQFKIPVGFQGVLKNIWFQNIPDFRFLNGAVTPPALTFNLSRRFSRLSEKGFDLPLVSSPGLNSQYVFPFMWASGYSKPGNVVDASLELNWKVAGGEILRIERINPDGDPPVNVDGSYDLSIINFVATILLGPAEIG